MNRTETRTYKNTMIARNLYKLDATAADLDAYAKEIGAGHFDRYERGYVSRKADVTKADVYVNLVTGRPYYYAPAYNTTQYKIRVYTDCKAKDFLEWLRDKRAAEQHYYTIVRNYSTVNWGKSPEEVSEMTEKEIIESAMQNPCIKVVAEYKEKKLALRDLAKRYNTTEVYKINDRYNGVTNGCNYFMDATIYFMVEMVGNKEKGEYKYADFE